MVVARGWWEARALLGSQETIEVEVEWRLAMSQLKSMFGSGVVEQGRKAGGVAGCWCLALCNIACRNAWYALSVPRRMVLKAK